jgi:hypothetical protein
MIAYHGDKAIKKKYLDRVKAHALADEIVKGKYWENGRGCAVGCTIHSGHHSAYETELGIPQVLALLEDGIFEALPNDLAIKWPERFLAAITPGADLSNVWPEFAVWLLVDEKFGVIQFSKTDAQREAIQSVADLYQLKLEGAIIDANDWLEARHAAYAAAYAAADAAAYAAAYAYDAAYAAAAAYAYDAAAYAYDAAAQSAKRTEWRIAQSEKLLELLKAAPTPTASEGDV